MAVLELGRASLPDCPDEGNLYEILKNFVDEQLLEVVDESRYGLSQCISQMWMTSQHCEPR